MYVSSASNKPHWGKQLILIGVALFLSVIAPFAVFVLFDWFNLNSLFAMLFTLSFVAIRVLHTESLGAFALVPALEALENQIGSVTLRRSQLFQGQNGRVVNEIMIVKLNSLSQIPAYYRARTSTYDSVSAINNLTNNYVYTLLGQTIAAGASLTWNWNAPKYQLDLFGVALTCVGLVIFLFRYWWPVYDRRHANMLTLLEIRSHGARNGN